MTDRKNYENDAINEILEEIAKKIETEAKTTEEAAQIIRDFKNKKADK